MEFKNKLEVVEFATKILTKEAESFCDRFLMSEKTAKDQMDLAVMISTLKDYVKKMCDDNKHIDGVEEVYSFFLQSLQSKYREIFAEEIENEEKKIYDNTTRHYVIVNKNGCTQVSCKNKDYGDTEKLAKELDGKIVEVSETTKIG